jgi:hypothetical protein
MIPADYHEFFLGAVTMGAALVGLLFVAISVNPGGAAATGGLAMRLRATSAFSALLNGLFVSLVALLPGGTIGGTVVGVAASGLLTVLGLLLMLVRKRGETGTFQLLRMVVLAVGQGAVYAFQIAGGVHLLRDPLDTGEVETQAILIIVLLAIGVLRAWEYVGAGHMGLLARLAEATSRSEPAGRSQGHEQGERPERTTPAAQPDAAAGDR